jgi:hypothetical protein
MRQNLRKTRNSVVSGDFMPPYSVSRLVIHNDKLFHMTARCEGAEYVLTCCKQRLNPPNVANICNEDTAPTCLLCVLCKGCPACRDGWVTEATMRLGKWVTKDDRKLYPFEMDDTHLMNAIKKLLRDEEHFKDNWLDWLGVLNAEANQRGLR